MRIFRYALAAVAIFGAVFSLVLARASALYLENTTDSSANAVKLVPFRAEYLVRFAAWHSEQRDTALKHAVEVDPFATQAWIDLGLEAEFRRNDQTQAENMYRHAADTNQMFLPKWTLTNFYFRNERVPEFLHWAKATLEITPYSASPVFAEMWLLVPDDPSRLAHAIPEYPNTLWQYAWYLSNAHANPAIPPIVARLVAATKPSEAETYGKSSIIGPITDRLLQAGLAEEALVIWSSLSAGHWVASGTPTVQRPISNGDFRTPLWPHGFDWVPITTPGVTTEQNTADRILRIEFSGDQPDPCAVLQEWVPLRAKQTYTLHWAATADSPDTAADLAWHIRTGSGKELGVSPSFRNAFGRWTFQFPGERGAYLLSLEYARQPGYTRAKGLLRFSNVTAAAN